MVGRALALLACAWLAACTAVPKDFAFDASSQQGLVLVEVEPVGDAGRKQPYGIQIAAFDPAKGLPQGWISLDQVGGTAGAPRYFIGRAAPGTYVISSFDHQASWYSCLNGGTARFEVAPGRATYLGRVDPRLPLLELALKTPSTSINGAHHYVLDTPRLKIAPPEQVGGWRENAAALLAANYPNVKAQLQPAVLTPTTFPTGRSLFGEKVCYGYFRKSASAPK